MLYIHIPYCKGKCIYCDFYSGGNPDWKTYLKAVAAELSVRTDELRGDSLHSIYLGGGTPSLIPPGMFLPFMEEIRGILAAADIVSAPDMELTIEVNPEDFSRELAEEWREAGINRLSMGVQSLDDAELRLLRRRHSADRAADALALLKDYFNNISVDVIYGIPGQKVGTLARTLDGLLAFAPQHVSAYALTYEEGTPLTVLAAQGRIGQCTEEGYLELGNVVVDKLEEAGFYRYEVSNFALPGFESRHNSGYWSGRRYVGLGPSASSYDGVNRRRTNAADIRSYLACGVAYREEILTQEERLEERIMLGLRTARGMELGALGHEFGESHATELLLKARRWISSGALANKDGFLKPTAQGFAIADYIILSLLT